MDALSTASTDHNEPAVGLRRGLEDVRSGKGRTASRAARQFLEQGVGAGVGVGIVIGLWWLGATVLGPARLPTPASVAEILFPVLTSSAALSSQGISGGIASGLLYTSEKVFIGVGAGGACGVLLGILLGVSRTANQLLSSVIEILRTIPPLAAVPFFLIWFGTAETGQFLLVGFYAAMMVVINARSAVQHLDPVYDLYAATLGAGRRARIRTITLPAMIPELVGGVRVALGFSWGIAVVAELLGAQKGIGHDFILLETVLAVNQIIASIIWISVIGAVVDRVYVILTKRFTRWLPRMREAA